MNPCGVCGSALPPREGISEILEIVHVESGIHFSRCRKHMSVGLTVAERVKAEKEENQK